MAPKRQRQSDKDGSGWYICKRSRVDGDSDSTPETEPESEPESEDESEDETYMKMKKHDVELDSNIMMMQAINLGRPSSRWQLKQHASHPRDTRIRFEQEGHIYYIDGKTRAIVSVTELIEVFYEPFPERLFIWRIQHADRYKTDRYYKYYKKTASQIKAVWEDARNQGTYNHKQLEDFYNGANLRLRFWDKNTHLENMFWQFNNRHSYMYEPFRAEIPIFADCGIAGAPDIIYRNKLTGKLLIGDFKFSRYLKDLSRNARTPFQHLKDNNKTRFSLQLSFYRYILETWYEYEFEGQFVLLLHKERTKYGKVDLPYRKKDVVDMINLYKMMVCIVFAVRISMHTI